MPTKSSNKIEQQVIDSLMTKLSSYGITHFYYSIVPAEQSELLQNMGNRTKFYFGNVNSQKKMRFAVVSDDAVLQFRELFLSQFSKLDRRFMHSIPCGCNDQSPLFFPQSKPPPERYEKKLQHLRAKIGMQSSVVSYHLLASKESWIGKFHLFSPMENSELRETLKPIEHEVHELLQSYSTLFDAHALQDLNPIANFGLLSLNCIKILKLAAEGDSSEEIGQKLFLSERGVNYHLDRARDLLGARNRTNLISKAYQKGVL